MLGLERQPVAARLERHHDFFERSVARALADAVDGALDLPRAGLHRRQRIRHRQAQIVVAVHADDRRVSPSACTIRPISAPYSSGTE